MQTTTPIEQGGYFSLGVPQTMICGKYPYGDHQYYGLFSSYGPQFQGRVMLPLDHNNDDGPVYVNAKQYHGIIRRRLSRAKALSRQKAPKIRKPFMHLSRHLHAMRRPRGCGGRFMNTKTMETGKETTKQIQKISANGVISHTTDSQSSEVLQSDCGSTKMSFLEVTSDPYPPFMFNHIRPIVHDFSGMLSAVGHGVVMPSKWVAATDRRCNLNA
ncbi:nuclear transcription factor Y subunit A-2-like [Impatiens glandulifera]|uniref:nuclear transcription factor Y subunit A-2-like n=1 Tax=Impatiens glandulifera TaxID=253017 RepID=UPI001FB10E1D|nr:nuclear transcription factor Y subunit A-2-like [Impatiens glandulifera]